MAKIYPDSKVEIGGILARHYGFLLNTITVGRYRNFIAKVIGDMGIKRDDRILDLGSGSGYNTKFMQNYIGPDGEIIGLDIGDTAIKSFRRKFRGAENIKVEKRRIDRPLPYKNGFDKVFTSFVFHGLPHDSRLKLLENVTTALKDDGRFFMLDYGDFDLTDLPFYLKFPFRALECKYAFDYLERDLDRVFQEQDLEIVSQTRYFKNFARLIEAKRTTTEKKSL